MDYEKDERYFLDDPVIKIYKDYWVTKDGEKLHIYEMGTNHIINCVKMLKRKIISENVFESMDPEDCDGHENQSMLREGDLEKELLKFECYQTFLDVLEYRDIKIEGITV